MYTYFRYIFYTNFTRRHDNCSSYVPSFWFCNINRLFISHLDFSHNFTFGVVFEDLRGSQVIIVIFHQCFLALGVTARQVFKWSIA